MRGLLISMGHFCKLPTPSNGIYEEIICGKICMYILEINLQIKTCQDLHEPSAGKCPRGHTDFVQGLNEIALKTSRKINLEQNMSKGEKQSLASVPLASL